jgi:AcrR family transcriptional regulator
MSKSPKAHPESDIRARIVEAMMRIAAERPFGDIALRDIAAEAGVTLLQFRDAFPSKGAALAGLSRMIDHETLSVDYAFGADDTAQDRLFAVLSRRLDALGPYREGLKSVRAWLLTDWAAALELNKLNVNAMRFACEAAGVETGGALANLKLQGLALAWARVVDIWLGEDGHTRALGALSAELSRGERAVAGLDGIERLLKPALTRMREGFRKKNASEPASDRHNEDDLATPL